MQRHNHPHLLLLSAFAFLLLPAACTRSNSSKAEAPGRVPEGFRIAEYAEVPGARSMTIGDNGTLFVGTRDDAVYAVLDTNHDGTGDRVLTIASGLNSPNGVAFRQGSLYVAEISRVLRYDNIEERLENPPDPVVVRDDFPSDTHHGWKFIAFGPDDKLYIPVGAPCNVCDEGDPYASILRMNPDGSELEVFARGIRNTVGFDWNPATGVLWFTDNGRDWLGDNLPPDELNRAPEPGLNFGFPYRHGDDIVDPEYGDQAPEEFDYQRPALNLGAHVAALGMRFYGGAMFPAEYRGRIFIAEHGSWNRSTKVGYRVVSVTLDGTIATGDELFATGWLHKDGSVSGRPVDVQELADGSLLVSDDYGGKIWRITYGQ